MTKRLNAASILSILPGLSFTISGRKLEYKYLDYVSFFSQLLSNVILLFYIYQIIKIWVIYPFHYSSNSAEGSIRKSYDQSLPMIEFAITCAVGMSVCLSAYQNCPVMQLPTMEHRSDCVVVRLCFCRRMVKSFPLFEQFIFAKSNSLFVAFDTRIAPFPKLTCGWASKFSFLPITSKLQ